MLLYSCSLLLSLFIGDFVPAELADSSNGNVELFLGKYPYENMTPSPIDINSEEVHIAFDLKPVEFRGILSEKLKVINTGQSVEAIAEREETDSGVTGGPLFNDQYQFKKVRFYWVKDTNGAAGDTVDGKDGAPLQAVVYYFNKKYKSFTNATEYRDGLAVAENDNPKFPSFAKSLKKILQAGSSTRTSFHTVFTWYTNVSSNTTYFTYPGAYTDEETEIQYYCTTAILLSRSPTMYLSKTQFEETFLSLKNQAGGLLTNKAKQFSRTQPVVKSKGISQELQAGIR